jgi:hypothetical protein
MGWAEEGAWTWLRQLAVLEGKWVKEASMVAAEGGTCMDLRRRPPMSPHSSISPTFTGRPCLFHGRASLTRIHGIRWTNIQDKLYPAPPPSYRPSLLR